MARREEDRLCWGRSRVFFLRKEDLWRYYRCKKAKVEDLVGLRPLRFELVCGWFSRPLERDLLPLQEVSRRD